VGDLDAALRMNDEQIALAEVEPGLGIATVGISTADSLWHRAMILTDLGRFAEAVEALRRADERARRFGDNEMVSWIDFWWVRALARAGDASGARSMARRALESAEKIGSVLGRVGAYGYSGVAYVLGKEWQSARDSLELALELGRANQAGRFLDAYYTAALAEAHLGLGDARRAHAIAGEAIGMAARMQMPVAEARAQLALARVLLAVAGSGGAAAIEAALDRAEGLARSTGARSYAPQIHVERARLAALLSDGTGRQQWLRDAHRLFSEMGATGHAERVAPLLEESTR
jgi:tetratricopeptide (TPR) repeat protein